MRLNLKTVKAAFLSAIAAASFSWAAAPQQFLDDCQNLTRHTHRLSGTAEFQQAADYVLERLQGMNPDQILTQNFKTVQTFSPSDKGLVPETASMTVVNADGKDGKQFTVLPMRPNGIMPPATPSEGISGPIRYLKSGTAEEFDRNDVDNAIVVLDYNSGQGFIRAFRLGAKAVIFTKNGPAEARSPHHSDTNVNLLRFYFDGPASQLPEEGSIVRLNASVVWKPVQGRNIFAFFKGTDPKFGEDEDSKDEVIILACNLDTFGEIPTLAPGARPAANCAALLQIADYISRHRPRRHVLISFFDCQARGHMGSSQFYRALEPADSNKKDVTNAKRRESLENEKDFVSKMFDVLKTDNPLTASSDVRRKLLDRLADKAQSHAYIYKDMEYNLNNENLEFRKQYGSNIPEDVNAKMEANIQERDNVVLPLKRGWNELQRIIGREKQKLSSAGQEINFKGVDDATKEKVLANLQVVLNEVKQDIEERNAELVAEDAALKQDAALLELLGDKWISLHASLLLGDTSNKWAVVIGGDSDMHSSDDNPGLYGKVQKAFLDTYKAITAAGLSTDFLVQSSDQTLQQTKVIWGGKHLIHSGEPAGLFGIYNLALATVQEAVRFEGTPDDTLDSLNLETISKQAEDIARFFAPIDNASAELSKALLANQIGLSLRRSIVANKDYVTPSFTSDFTTKGPMVMGMLQGTSIPNTPMKGAIVQFQLNSKYSLAYSENKFRAFDNFHILSTNSNGNYELGPVHAKTWATKGGLAAIFDKNGIVKEISGNSSYTTIKTRLNTFSAKSAYVVLPSQQRTERGVGEEVGILSSKANASLEKTKSFSETVDGVVSWFSEEREKGVKLFSLRQMVGLNNGPQFLASSGTNKSTDQTKGQAESEEEATGQGFEMNGQPIAINAAARSSSDLWRLNESRLDILRSKGILDSSLAELHGRSEDLLIEAAKQGDHPMKREALNTASFWASRPVYNKVRDMLDDLVFAVLILLALSVPFAFALERVIVGAVNVYKQISWFVFFFAITFLVLYLSHPAFAIASTPIIIFLGFAIVVMSVMVIFIIMQKFEVELKAIQGMTATVHVNDVSSVSTFMAAMQMGISTMRRRPTRTALTAITIILLTFTILCFASFGTQNGIVTLSVAPNPNYTGAFVHNVNWNPLSEDLKDIIRFSWIDSSPDKSQQPPVVCRRLWISPSTTDNPGILLTKADGTQPLTIKGVLGIEPEELKYREELAEYFGNLDDDTILITKAVADTMQVAPGDKVIFKGNLFTVGQLMDAVKVSAAKDMDTSSILPADFTATSSTTTTTTGDDAEADAMSERNWTSIPVDQVAVLSANAAQKLGATLYGMTVYTQDVKSAVENAEKMARMLSMPIPATRDNGVYRHLLGTVLTASGAKDLFFPIVLGGLVIFGTMLGSVADRQKEIYTFSALGLAPKHVATLFFAESMVYALVGGLGGYLLAQGTLKTLGVAAEFGLVRVPEMNMSSTNTIVTILIVMATVLISSVYPAIKASKSANPGLMRIWRPPKAQGDVLDLVFPFTVSQYDITGVLSFLQEHFANHTDTGLGRFMTSSVELIREQETNNLGLKATLALAPFDLGVSQNFLLTSTASEIEGIDEIRVILTRISGQPKDWQRLNKIFLDDLRQQFLIWRSIPKATMEMYRQRTLSKLGANPPQETK